MEAHDKDELKRELHHEFREKMEPKRTTKDKAKSWLGMVATVLGIIISMTTIMNYGVNMITREIIESTTSLAEMHKDDLSIRLRILKREIAEKERDNGVAPDRLYIRQDAIIDQIAKVNEKWFQNK